MEKRVRCPDCKRVAEPICGGEKAFTIYTAKTDYIWYRCSRCNKNFIARVHFDKVLSGRK